MLLRPSPLIFLFHLALLCLSPAVDAAPSGITRHEETVIRRQNPNQLQEATTVTTITHTVTCVEMSFTYTVAF